MGADSATDSGSTKPGDAGRRQDVSVSADWLDRNRDKLRRVRGGAHRRSRRMVVDDAENPQRRVA